MQEAHHGGLEKGEMLRWLGWLHRVRRVNRSEHLRVRPIGRPISTPARPTGGDRERDWVQSYPLSGLSWACNREQGLLCRRAFGKKQRG